MLNFAGSEPGDFMRFIACVNGLIVMRDEQKTDVVMLMGVFDHLALFIKARWNLMHIHIKWYEGAVDGNDVKGGHTGFFLCLAKCHEFDVRLAIGMAAQLKPAIQLAMVGQ